MKIGIAIRENHAVWGGDLKVVYDLKWGLEQLGCKITVSDTVLSLLEEDFILLTNSTRDQRSQFDLLQLYTKPYGLLSFHEDPIQYALPCFGFANYVEKSLEGYVESGVPFTLDRLLATPQIVFYFGFLPMRSSYYNFEVMEKAQFCLVDSPTEKRTLKRDCPLARPIIVPLSPGFSSDEGKDGFLNYRDYVLQVGRFETRKNQLGSILAMRDIPHPLVFIATKTHQPWYEKICLNAILNYRSHPTFIISETLDSGQKGPLTVMKMPDGKKLSSELLKSAYANASLYLHPAFSETPGFIFFEAARAGIPIIASEWCTFKDLSMQGPIEYPCPYDVNAIEKSIKSLLGKKATFHHSSLSRTPLDYARDVYKHLSSSSKI